MRPLPPDLSALAAGGKAALAGCLTALETRPDDPALARLLDAAWGAPRGAAIGLTGPPGVGKSTLVNALIARLRQRGDTVAVVAVDPSSRRTGGALLGDRTRIETDPEDAGVFLRSMAARRRLGGIAEFTFPAVVLMRALYDMVFVETVGVGQSETEIADCADLTIFCAQPGSGDALQFMKAGVMEVPDLVLVTKGDLGAPAQRAAADLRGALSLAADGSLIDVAIVSARTGDGLYDALDLITDRLRALPHGASLARRRQDQARRWAESQILESFGTVGLGTLAPRLAGSGTPFLRLAMLRKAATPLLHKSLKEL